MSEERNAIPLIITGICSILGTVATLWYYGYLHFAKPEDALLLNQFTMLKTVPGEDYKVSLEPAPRSPNASMVCWCCSTPSRKA